MQSFTRLLLTGLLGMGVSFFAHALSWTIEAHKELTFGGLDSPSSVRMVDAGSVSPMQTAAAHKRFISQMKQSGATAIFYSVDGPPVLRVFEGRQHLSWIPDEARGPLFQGSRSVALVKGSFSELQNRNGLPSPLVPRGATVIGSLYVPQSVARNSFQYVKGMQSDHEMPGTYLFSNLSPSHRESVLDALSAQGMRPTEGESLPISTYLRDNPLLRLIGLTVILGYACAAMYWMIECSRDGNGITLRQQLGGHPLRILSQRLFPFLPVAAIGSLTASALVGGTTLSAGGTGTTLHDQLWLGICGAGLSLALTSFVYGASIGVVITRSRT